MLPVLIVVLAVLLVLLFLAVFFSLLNFSLDGSFKLVDMGDRPGALKIGVS